jgi:energy-coupling factor transport system permease protein
MDARGYGRSGELSAGQRRTTGVLLVGGLLGLCVGTYAFLDSTAPRSLAWPMLVGGLGLATAGFLAAGRRVARTRYRPERWHVADLLTAATGVAVAVLTAVAASGRPDVAFPDPASAPPLSGFALLAVLVGILPAFVAPPPVMAGDGDEVPEQQPVRSAA